MLHIEGWRICRAGIGPWCVACGGECHVPHSDRIQGAQHGQRTAQRVSALDAGQRTKLLVLVRLNDVCRRKREKERERGGISKDFVKVEEVLHFCKRERERERGGFKLGRTQFVFGN